MWGTIEANTKVQILNNEILPKIVIYPNPVDHFFTIQFESPLEIRAIHMVDALGQIIPYSQDIMENQIKIELQTMAL